MTRSNLEHRLLDFGGKAVTVLTEARNACRDRPNYLDELASLCFDPRTAVADGATWILKAELDNGMELPARLTARIVKSLDKARSWQTVLHLCQSVDKLVPTAAQAKRVIDWARSYENHPRPFLRAWSLHARAVLANRFPKFAKEAALAVRMAEADDAASVRARARQLRKALKLG